MADSTDKTPKADEYGVFDDAKTYYASEERHQNRFGPRTRTYSQVRPALYRHKGRDGS